MAKPGQPTKYRKDFHNEDFIRLSKQGKTLIQIALEWDVDRHTIMNWANRHKEFFATVKKGREYSEAWYANLGQLAMLGKARVNGEKVTVNLGFYVWLTKNMFKWTDKVQVKEESKDRERPCKSLSDEELDNWEED